MEKYLNLKRSQEELDILQREMRHVISFYQIQFHDLQKVADSIRPKLEDKELPVSSIPLVGRYAVSVEGKKFLQGKLSLVESAIAEKEQHLKEVCETFQGVMTAPSISDMQLSDSESEYDSESEDDSIGEENDDDDDGFLDMIPDDET